MGPKKKCPGKSMKGLLGMSWPPQGSARLHPKPVRVNGQNPAIVRQQMVDAQSRVGYVSASPPSSPADNMFTRLVENTKPKRRRRNRLEAASERVGLIASSNTVSCGARTSASPATPRGPRASPATPRSALRASRLKGVVAPPPRLVKSGRKRGRDRSYSKWLAAKDNPAALAMACRVLPVPWVESEGGEPGSHRTKNGRGRAWRLDGRWDPKPSECYRNFCSTAHRVAQSYQTQTSMQQLNCSFIPEKPRPSRSKGYHHGKAIEIPRSTSSSSSTSDSEEPDGQQFPGSLPVLQPVLQPYLQQDQSDQGEIHCIRGCFQ